eukprot:746958-Hanusia_phi.AAC.3
MAPQGLTLPHPDFVPDGELEASSAFGYNRPVCDITSPTSSKGNMGCIREILMCRGPNLRVGTLAHKAAADQIDSSE